MPASAMEMSTRKRLRTPLFPQLETSECGAACLGIVLAHYGRWEPIEKLRDACGVSRDGTSAADIVRAARKFDLQVTGWRREISQLHDIELPAILFWEFNHFLVLEGIDKGRYHLNDPANGRRTVSEETFDRSFTGVVLTAKPGPNFLVGSFRPGSMRELLSWLRDVKSPLAFVAICGLLLAVPGLFLPILLSIFVDYVLGEAERTWGVLLVAAAAATGGLVYLLTWLQQHALRRLAVRLAVVHAERMLSRLFRLPVEFFAHRYTGDLTSRVQLINEVASGSSRHFVGIMIELVMSALFLVLMILYDPLLAAVVAALGFANIVLMRILSRLHSDENRQLRREQALLFGTGSSVLRDIDTLQATATEDGFFARWAGYQARELVARQKFAELGYIIASLPRLFLMLGGVAVLGLGGWKVMSGDMTIGMLMGFYVVAGNFLQPIGRFVQFADTFQILEADLQRIGDILAAPEDPALKSLSKSKSGKIATLGGRLRLAGKIELRNVTFGYHRHRPPLIENFSLTIEPGQRVALVGPTGSGKSTLLKLVSGEYTPWSGEILFDGVPRNEIPREILTQSISIVDQQIFLFAASVRDNLTMWNPTAPDEQVVAAAQDALIHSEIMSRASGYETRVEEGGTNFSGGQRQRLEIARALVDNPSVLFLDEATSTLDAVSEMRIDGSLRRRGCTCMIVAHRLSTIRDCDQIVVLDHGHQVQSGTHEELVAETQGVYSQLIHAQ
ncbi:MAG: NHLP family bacteriocin export ABC transporter peptidase/permease/ATPase subunit [Chloroflexota bacterium]|nr:NHLP family bacteriocin export ABC transporter peptidase/permease/ATPase subunit [Chloroflexota bacterium]